MHSKYKCYGKLVEAKLSRAIKTYIPEQDQYALNFVLHFELALLTDSYWVDSKPFSRSPEPSPLTSLAN